MRDRRQSNAVDVHHDAGAAVLFHQIVAAQHVVDVASDVECIHRFLAGLVGDFFDFRHDGGNPFRERRVVWVGLQFIVLDEVETGNGEVTHQACQCVGRQPDAGFDDGADQRQFLDLREFAGAGDAESRSRIALGKRRGQLKVLEPNA